LVLLNHVRHAGSVAKAETAIELAQDIIDEGGQVVIFVAFKDSGHQISKSLECKMLSGDTPNDERQVMVDDFQSGKYNALVCTFGAGGVGITLTAAQNVILVDRAWTSGDVEQSEDRLHRIGQKSAVTATWLQYGKVDIAIDELIQSKAERIELVLQGKRKTMRGVGSTPTEIANELLPMIME
jgi:SNF2 family DNA or RNA helicase